MKSEIFLRKYGPFVPEPYIQTDRQTGRQTDRQTDKQTDKQIDKQTDRQTDKQTNKQTPVGLWPRLSKDCLGTF